jgi:hypothetical protein
VTWAATRIAAGKRVSARAELGDETILRGPKAFNRLCQKAKMERKETAKSHQM